MAWDESRAWRKGRNNQKLYQALLDDWPREISRVAGLLGRSVTHERGHFHQICRRGHR